MTTAPVLPGRPVRAMRLPLGAARRLLRLELRRNAMLWMLPLVAGLFWFLTFRRTMALPPLWNVRAMSMQGTAIAVFIPTVVGAAAWMGSREARLGLTDQLAVTPRPRWARQLATWAATTGWALAAYVVCVGALYGVTARQAAWGGPLWWPVAVGAASLPALSALGFAAGTIRPSRFTPPLAAVAAFLALEISLQFIHGAGSYWQISPLVAGPWDLGTNEGVATFYAYLPDLPIAQLIFLAGVTALLLGVLGLPAGAGGRTLRRAATVITAAGLAIAGTAVALAGTGQLDGHGMIAIPALHDQADDRPVPYTPVCSHTAIPVCLHPAYTVYLSAVTDALEPVLSEVAGLPGAPVRISQATTAFQQQAGNGVEVRVGQSMSGTPPVYAVILPNQLPGPARTVGESATVVRTTAGPDILASVLGDGLDPAQRAVMAAMRYTSGLTPDPPADGPAQRFAALPAAARHAWLVEHLGELRAGQITLEQLP
jgi:hypothetical protein